MFAGRKMLGSCHVAIICDQSNSLLKMLMVDAQKLSRTLVRQMILLFPVPQEDLIQARSQMIFYNVTLRLGRNLRKGKVVLSTCFFFSCFKVPSDDACSWNTKLSQWRYVQVLVSFYLYTFLFVWFWRSIIRLYFWWVLTQAFRKDGNHVPVV